MKLCVSPQCPVVNGTGVVRELDDDADVCDGCGADQPQQQPVVQQPVQQQQPVVQQPVQQQQPVVQQPVQQQQPVVADPNAGQPVAPVVPWYKRYSASTWAWIAVAIIVVLVVIYFGIKGVIGAGEAIVGGPGPSPDPSHDPAPRAPDPNPDPNPDPPRPRPEPPFNPGTIGRPGLPAIAGQCDPGLTRVEYDPTSGASDPSADPVCGYGGLITEPAEKEGQLYYCCRR